MNQKQSFADEHDIHSSIFKLDTSTIFQLYRNVDADHLGNINKNELELFKEIRSAIQSPNSLNNMGSRKISQIKIEDVKSIMKKLDLNKFFRKNSLYLNQEIRSGRKNNFVSRNEFFIRDLTFLKFFRNLTGLNLFGQTVINSIKALESLEHLEELNIEKTNITDFSFLKNLKSLKYLHVNKNFEEIANQYIHNGVELICDSSSKLKVYSEYESVRNWRENHNKFVSGLSKLSNYTKDRDSQLYPQVFFPLSFTANPKSFLTKDILVPDFINTNELSIKGRSEAAFLLFLKREFPGIIHNELSFNRILDYRPKFPDFILSHKNYPIYIDIEIDEPYSLNDGSPIHCLGQDIARNFEFLYHNWFVIRFTEEQVVKYPEQCCKLIYKFQEFILAHICEDNQIKEFKYDFAYIQNPWTEEESRIMFLNKYRDTY
jgi:hypothetical protein